MHVSSRLCAPAHIVILGAPGSGKGTISKRLRLDFNLKYISSGDLLRNTGTQNTGAEAKLKSFMSVGKLVPDEVVEEIMLKEVKKYSNANLLLDGFPRTLSQAKFIENYFPLTCVLNLAVPFDEIVNRLRYRWTHISSGRIYNDEFNPPKVKGLDDVTGEPLVQRDDDKPEAVQKRLSNYAKMTNPMLDFYRDKGILHTFTGRYSNELWPKVHKATTNYLAPLHYTEYK